MIKSKVRLLLCGAAVVAMLSAVNVRIAATECIKDCGCVDTQHYGDSPGLACPYQEMCKFRECVYTKEDCYGWPYSSYVNECDNIPTCDNLGACGI